MNKFVDFIDEYRSKIEELSYINTSRLLISKPWTGDAATETSYTSLHKDLLVMNPPVGQCNECVVLSIRVTDIHNMLNTLIGKCSMYNPTSTTIEIGVSIFVPELWGRGYGPDVVNALCDYIIANFSFVRGILAKTPNYNNRSHRCFNKCGFIDFKKARIGRFNMIYMLRRI